MKSPVYISNLKKSLFFLLGILVAVFVVSQEVVDYHCEQICEEIIEADEEDADKESEQDLAYSLSTQVLLPVSGFELEPFQAIFIGEVIRETEEKVHLRPEVTLYNSPHFKTLFRQIQSPNAP